MRAMRLAVAVSGGVCLLALLVVAHGCHEGSASTPVFYPGVPLAFEADQPTLRGGEVHLTGAVSGPREVVVSIEQNVDPAPFEFTALLSVDPTALEPTDAQSATQWSCGEAVPFTVTATGTPGEWLVHRGGSPSNPGCYGCGSSDPDNGVHVGRVTFAVKRSGAFRVDVREPAQGQSVCGCDGCPSASFFGGKVVATD